MTFLVYHVNKKTGVKYAYESVSFWDKEKRQSRNKQVCIGKIDPVDGKLIPSKRRASAGEHKDEDVEKTASFEIIGPTTILDELTQKLKLEELLKSCFPDSYKKIQIMAYYLAVEGNPLCYCANWCKRYAPDFAEALSSQRISELLTEITINEKEIFLSKWMKLNSEDDYLCYDISSVSSYSQSNEYIKLGYNRDHENLPQLNLAMVFGQKNQLPLYYHRLPGSITDVVTVHNLLKTFKALEMKRLHYVMDKGFYSHKNVNDLFCANHKFIVSVPINNKWVQKEIDKVNKSIHGPEGYRRIDDEVLYAQTNLYSWGKDRRRSYLHIYYNAQRKAEAVDKFNAKLVDYKQELESEKLIEAHKEDYETYFVIKNTPKRGLKVSYNTEAIQQYISKYAGFQVYLSNGLKEAVETLQIYRNKDVVEKSFDDMKNALDMKRLRMHTAQTVDGRLFVQFIALIYISALRKALRESKLIEKYTVRDVLEEMKTLAKIKYTGKRRHVLTEMTKTQRHILEALNIAIPV
jgi:transposase